MRYSVVLFLSLLVASSSMLSSAAFANEQGLPQLNATVTPSLEDWQPKSSGFSLAEVEYTIDESLPQVTLQSGEKLQDAYERLRVLTTLDGSAGESGILNIAHDPLQCDMMRSFPNRHFNGTLVIRGIAKPDGTMPKAYCRDERLGGTIAAEDRVETFAKPIGREATVIIGMDIDGYQKGVIISSGTKGFYVLGSRIRFARADGLAYSNYTEANHDLKVVIAGSELSHSGNGNALHCTYMHRALDPTSTATVYFVDNLVYSCNYSSGFKSIANANYIANNIFLSEYQRDPAEPRKWSQAIIDVAGCAQNYIVGNKIYYHKVELNRGGQDIIQIRNRSKVVRGCDRPDYDSVQFQDPNYWASLNGATLFKTHISGNEIFTSSPYKQVGDDDFGYKTRGIVDWGTHPTDEATLGVSYWLPLPEGWYERHRVVLDGTNVLHYTDIDGQLHSYTLRDRPEFLHSNLLWHNPRSKMPMPKSPGDTHYFVTESGAAIPDRP